jgi:oxaloacetate decarboxylase
VTKELIEAAHAELRIPLMLGGGGAGLEKAWLGQMGVRISLQGHQPFSASVQAVYNTLKALRDGTKPSELTGIASAETMAKVTRAGDYKSWTEKFMS